MKHLFGLAFALSLTWWSRFDEPKPFLVVLGDGSQTVVDITAWRPDRNDAMRTIAAGPKRGLVSWTGARLAFLDTVPGQPNDRAVFVTDLAVARDAPPFQATAPTKALELIGWLGMQNLVVIRDREEASDMLRVAGARLAKDAKVEAGIDVTSQPGVYEHATTNRQGALAYFSKRGNDGGQVIVWQDKVTRVIADDVAASDVCWSPDGAQLAVAELGKVTVFAVADPTQQRTYPLPPGCRDRPARIGSMAWRPDAASLALLPDWPEPDHAPGNPRVWSLDLAHGDCTVLVALTTPAKSVRWLDGTGCDTALDEACELATAPVVGRRAW